MLKLGFIFIIRGINVKFVNYFYVFMLSGVLNVFFNFKICKIYVFL